LMMHIAGVSRSQEPKLARRDPRSAGKENPMLKRLLNGFGLLAAFVVIAATLTMLFNGRGAAQQSAPENVVAGVFSLNPLQVALLQWYPANLTTWFAVGTGPEGVVFDGANIWVANHNSNNITKLQANDGTVLGTFDAGNGPQVAAFDGSSIWVADYLGNNVTKLRASDGAQVGAFDVGSGPQGVAFDGANVWVTNTGSNSVSKLRAADGRLLGTFAVGLDPNFVAFDGAGIWVTN
jgi:outer membrane protein assembly factor BamB